LSIRMTIVRMCTIPAEFELADFPAEFSVSLSHD
jgi:hypothetical protein